MNLSRPAGGPPAGWFIEQRRLGDRGLATFCH
jgi:hypothetical protein